MTKEEIIRKLTSRKLWMSIALFVSGCLTYAGHADDARAVQGLIMQGAAVLGYILGEGLVDAARIGGEQYDLMDAGAEEDDLGA
jgi:hypothetical protein